MQLKLPIIPEYNNESLTNKIQAHLDDLTKPRGSLGRLEECALKYCMCRGNEHAKIKKIHLLTVAGDHGITRQKITPFPPEVTMQMVLNMINGGAAVSVMCKNAGIWYSVVDAGVAAELPDHPLLIKRKTAPGTMDFSEGYAMFKEQCKQALTTGISLAENSGADLLGLGEMGIGNSAAASALYALLLDLEAHETTGAGTGAHGDLLTHKITTIQKALDFHRAGWDKTPFDALCRCGGFEIAVIAGMIIGSAAVRTPVVIDGFIAGAAALVALRMAPAVRHFCFFSHVSAENFHRSFCAKEGIIPLLDLGMRLGEGTGAVLAMQIIVQAMECYHEMATFSSASVANEIKN